jgi:zinc protease
LIQQPAFPESEFEQLRSQAITSIERARAEPQTVAGRAVSRHFSPWPAGHPYHAPDFDQQIAELRALSVDDLRDFHARFHGAGDGEIAVVGDFDPDALLAQLEATFGGWTRGVAFERIPDPLPTLAPVRQALPTPDKANAVLYARADFAMSDSHPDYPALVAANQVFGGGGMKAWLADRIREREGLSYSVASSLSASPHDERASLMVHAIAAPENIPRVELALREELARLLEAGVAEDELRDALSALLQARQRSRAEDSVLAAQLRGNAYLGRSMAWTGAFEARLGALTADEVNAAVRRHLGGLELSVFSAGDFDPR